MSSRYMKMKRLRKSLSTSFINAWNTAGVLVSPNGITAYSKWPRSVESCLRLITFSNSNQVAGISRFKG